MLITDINTLQTVYTLNFPEHIILYCTDSFDFQQIVRIYATFCQLVTGFQNRPIQHSDTGTIGNEISFAFSCLLIGNDNFPFFLRIPHFYNAAKLCDNRKTFWLSRFEKLLYTGKTLGNIITGYAACVERTHCQLCARFPNGLCSYNTHCFSYLYWLSTGHVRTITFGTDTVVGTASQYGTDFHCFHRTALIVHTFTQDTRCTAGCNHMIFLNNNISVSVFDLLAGDSSCNSVFEALDGFLAIHERFYRHAGNIFPVFGAVDFTNNQLL